MGNRFNDVYISEAEFYIQECFSLAKNGLGRTSPNPIVGAIVLDKNGTPIGRGFHAKAGENHAEVNALKEAGEKAKDGTLFVSLEPCCHHGKTPPCTDLIIKSGINKVYFSSYDPNPLVNSSGENALKDANIKVFSRILEHTGNELNKFFFKWIKTKRPWVTLKQAQTLNAKISLSNDVKTMISSHESIVEVHKLRNYYDAVMVGSNTVKIDDPELTVRFIEGGRNPKRIILDTNLDTSPSSKVYKTNKYNEVYIFTKNENDIKINQFKSINPLVNIISIKTTESGLLDLSIILDELGKLNILSVLIEGGQIICSEFINKDLIDEYILFISPQIFTSSNAISAIKLQDKETIYKTRFNDYRLIGQDLMISLYPTRN